MCCQKDDSPHVDVQWMMSSMDQKFLWLALPRSERVVVLASQMLFELAGCFLGGKSGETLWLKASHRQGVEIKTRDNIRPSNNGNKVVKGDLLGRAVVLCFCWGGVLPWTTCKVVREGT